MFDPTADGKRIRPKRPALLRSTYFTMGEIAKRCRDALREATGPVSADDIAAQTMQDKGMDRVDKTIRSDVGRRLIWTLHRLESAGHAREIAARIGAR